MSGRFASDHISELVIMEAKALIKSREHSIREISETLNFNSQSLFCRYFKKATGRTPLAIPKRGLLPGTPPRKYYGQIFLQDPAFYSFACLV